MRAIAATFLGTHLLRIVAGHRDGDLIQRISPDMLHDLLMQGIARAFWTHLVILPAIVFFLSWAAARFQHNDDWMSAYNLIVYGLVLVGSFAVTWKKSALAPVEREILYFRMHRKWRWDR